MGLLPEKTRVNFSPTPSPEANSLDCRDMTWLSSTSDSPAKNAGKGVGRITRMTKAGIWILFLVSFLFLSCFLFLKSRESSLELVYSL